jgi:hypothetical protein
MGTALDVNGVPIHANSYVKTAEREPLACDDCGTRVEHVSAHVRELQEKSVDVANYFKLYRGSRHAQGCQYIVGQEVKLIAKESKGLLESIKDGNYRLRLMMIMESLGVAPPKDGTNGGKPGGRTGVTYDRSPGALAAYINSAQRVVKLRAICEEDEEIAKHIELVFEGDTVIPWSQFFFDTDRLHEAYRTVSQNTVQHPIALHGFVKAIKPIAGKNGPTNVMNLQLAKYRNDESDPKNGISVSVSAWSENAAWFNGLAEDTEVVILGLWRAKAGKPQKSTKQGRFESVTFNELNLNLDLAVQIAPVQPQ